MTVLNTDGIFPAYGKEKIKVFFEKNADN